MLWSYFGFGLTSLLFQFHRCERDASCPKEVTCLGFGLGLPHGLRLGRGRGRVLGFVVSGSFVVFPCLNLSPCLGRGRGLCHGLGLGLDVGLGLGLGVGYLLLMI